jgi:zinc/manganese transport system permease protein
LAGSLLWVSWPTVIKTLLAYLAVGLFHYIFRRRFTLISEHPEEAFAQGLRVRLWDFLFYISFGVTITLSVGIAGVLMVFTYLVAPAIIALAVSSAWRVRLGLAYAVGLLASALGLFASYHWDLPSGPAIVCVFGLSLALFAAVRGLRKTASTSTSSC